MAFLPVMRQSMIEAVILIPDPMTGAGHPSGMPKAHDLLD
jgi:hypothetical protein